MSHIQPFSLRVIRGQPSPIGSSDLCRSGLALFVRTQPLADSLCQSPFESLASAYINVPPRFALSGVVLRNFNIVIPCDYFSPVRPFSLVEILTHLRGFTVCLCCSITNAGNITNRLRPLSPFEYWIWLSSIGVCTRKRVNFCFVFRNF